MLVYDLLAGSNPAASIGAYSMRYCLVFIMLFSVWGCADRPARNPYDRKCHVAPIESAQAAPVISVRRVLFELPEYQNNTDRLSEPL